MTVNLSPELQAFVESQVGRGSFASTDEVFMAAVARLRADYAETAVRPGPSAPTDDDDANDGLPSMAELDRRLAAGAATESAKARANGLKLIGRPQL